MQEGCVLCPRKCGVDRNIQRGACNAPCFPYVAKAALHMWEEPCISGKRGSGAIFFCGCNLKCVFCQNYDISNGSVGKMYDVEGIAELMLRLQGKGAHNVNLVSPAPFVPVLADAIRAAKNRGLSIPVVYNTNSYETVVLLSKGEIDSKKVRVEFSLEDMDMSGFQKGATYEQIKAYVLEHTGLKVSSLYISQIKRKCGLDVGQNYNLSKKEDAKVPKCPPEKEAAIRDALKYFQMI